MTYSWILICTLLNKDSSNFHNYGEPSTSVLLQHSVIVMWDNENMNISIDKNLKAGEVVHLRERSGWDHDEKEWESCIKQNLINVSARNDDGEVVGVGFLCGNQRHAELVDMVVHPAFRKQGIGRKISKIIIDYAVKHKIKYFGLTYDKDFPWLKEFYESEGFRLIDFAMWHESSIKQF